MLAEIQDEGFPITKDRCVQPVEIAVVRFHAPAMKGRGICDGAHELCWENGFVQQLRLQRFGYFQPLRLIRIEGHCLLTGNGLVAGEGELKGFHGVAIGGGIDAPVTSFDHLDKNVVFVGIDGAFLLDHIA